MNVLQITVNGQLVDVAEPQGSLLDTLRYQLGLTSVKDGCSPQGQCGCCTVLVDGQARVSCVTPVRRIRGRSVETMEGLVPERKGEWAERFCATGASQCGFCTPGIIMRLEAIARDSEVDVGSLDHSQVDQGLLAHLCRCTGWQTIVEAACGGETAVALAQSSDHERDLELAGRRATLEGGTPQVVSAEVPAGRGGFAADTVPADCLVAVIGDDGEWAVGESLFEARQQAGKVQGRRTTVSPSWPIAAPDGPWAATLQTTWVDGAYLETDAAWCEPGGVPASVEANGGAFGAKWPPDGGGVAASAEQPLGIRVADASRRLADRHGRTVLALASREDVTRFGLKRPPVAGGVAADGSGLLRVARTPGLADVIAAGLAANPELVDGSDLTVEEVDVAGPPTSARVRAAGWAEAIVLLSALANGTQGADRSSVTVRSPAGATAIASVTTDDEGGVAIHIQVSCGPVLDAVVLRSYCIGAAHMAWSWLTAESLAVDDVGEVHDLTVRSFGVLRAVDTPPITVELAAGEGEPVNGSDAVFAAVAAAGWRALGRPAVLPAGLPLSP